MPCGCSKAGCFELYMLAPENSSLMNCFVIKTPNNKIVVIDGGGAGAGHDSETYLPAAIRAILGLKENAYFEVEAWFLTHGHNDHFYELAKLLNQYGTGFKYCNYKINNFYFDFPEFGDEWSSKSGKGDYNLDDLEILKDGLLNYYKQQGLIERSVSDNSLVYNQLNGAVINREALAEGLSIEIDGVTFDILKAFNGEDLNVNSTSIIIRMSCGGHSVLFLNDAYIDTGDWLLKNYTAEELKSDYVQMAHHGQSGTSEEFYNAIDTKNSVRLWCTPYWVWDVYEADNGIKTDVTRSWLDLPADPEEFLAEGLFETGNDIVAGKYELYPEDRHLTASWTKKVLMCQQVFSYKV